MICPDEVSQVDIPGSASLLAHIIIEINQKREMRKNSIEFFHIPFVVYKVVSQIHRTRLISVFKRAMVRG